MATLSAARPTARRSLAMWLAVVLALAALAALPAGAAAVDAAATGCGTVTLTSPAPLKVHVLAAECGDSTSALSAVVADLVQDSTRESIKSWTTPGAIPATTWIDEDVDVPAQGGYTLTITAFLSDNSTNVVETKVAVLGGVAVTVSHPELRFRAARMTATSFPALVKWSDTSNNPRFGYRVRINTDGVWGPWTFTAQDSYAVTVKPGHTYHYQVLGLNLAKVAGPIMSSLAYTPKRYSETSSMLGYTGTWRTSLNSRYLGGRTRFAKAAGATASFTFTGAAAAIVMPLGPSRGSYRVYADGLFQKTVKTYSSAAGYRFVVYGIAWPDAGTHVVKLRVNGTSGHPRVDLDGIITLE